MELLLPVLLVGACCGLPLLLGVLWSRRKP